MLKWPGRNRVQITCNTSSAHHAHVVCHLVRRGSSAIKFNRVEMGRGGGVVVVCLFVCFFFSLILLAEPSNR